MRSRYLAALVREPSARELEHRTACLAGVADPATGCTDLPWARLNATEFRVNR